MLMLGFQDADGNVSVSSWKHFISETVYSEICSFMILQLILYQPGILTSLTNSET